MSMACSVCGISTPVRNEKIRQLRAASHDPLTGIYNRTAFEKVVTNHVRSSIDAPCGMLMLMDIDNFKSINDKMGHLKGDEALRRVSGLLLDSFGPDSCIGRLGGDEFLIFTPNSQLSLLSQQLTRMLNRLQSDRMPCRAASEPPSFHRRILVIPFAPAGGRSPLSEQEKR